MTGNEGRHPDEVGDLVFDAVRKGQFFINTMDAVPMLRERFDAVLAGDLPPSAAFGDYPAVGRDKCAHEFSGTPASGSASTASGR